MPGTSSTGSLRVRTLMIEAAVVGLGAVAVAFVVLQLWRGELSVPFVYNGDGSFNIMMVKGIVDNGWFQHNPHLGFPYGLNLLDYPQGADHLHFLAMRVLSFGTNDAGVVLNLFYVGTYAVTAASAYIAARLMGRLRVTAIGIALLFVFLPYHVFRGEYHVFLSGLEGIPLAALLVYWVFQTRPVLFAESARGLLRNRRAMAAIVMALLLGATGAYYAVFTALPLGIAGLAGIAAGWGWRRSLSALALSGIVMASLLGNLAPSIVYRVVHGTNVEVTHRDPIATEAFGLKISQMVLPVQGHRIDRLAALQQRSYNPTQPSEGAQQLGAIGSLGFLGLIGWILVRLVRRKPAEADPKIAPLAFGTVVLILCGTIGGFSMVFALAGLTEIRSWNRVSVLIGFFSLSFVALLLERGFGRLKERRPQLLRNGLVLGVAVPLFLVAAIAEETTSKALPNYEASKTAFVQDRAFVRGLEAQLPKGAAVFQLPYIPFPETPPRFGMADYDHVRGYLHSQHLNWSYGEVKGRHGNWQLATSTLPVEQMLPALVGAGFSAVWLDTAGYEDGGELLDAALTATAGPPMAQTSRYRVFDLRPVRDRFANQSLLATAGAAATHPVEIAFGHPWQGAEYRDGHTQRFTPKPAAARFNNVLGRPRAVTVYLFATAPRPIRLSISHPGGVDGFELTPELQSFSFQMTLPADGARLQFDTPSGFTIADLRVVDNAIAAASLPAK